jgi:hypothetical protein
MELLIYGVLLLATLLALALLIYLFRARSIEHRLKMLEAIADLSSRVSQMENAVHANATAPVERKLDSLQSKLKDIDGRLAAAAASDTRRVAPVASGDMTDADLVLKTLHDEGYSRIHIVNDHVIAGGPREFRVEVMKNGMQYKGSVFVQNGVLGETRLAASQELFP